MTKRCRSLGSLLQSLLIVGGLLLPLVVAVAACSSEEPDRTAEPEARPAPSAPPAPSRPVPPPEPQQLFGPGSGTTEDAFRALLTDKDINGILGIDETLSATFFDLLVLAAFSDPAQIAAVETFYGLTFETRDGKALSLSLIDFDTASSASGHFSRVVARTGILTTGQSVGDRDFSVELNADGLWATFGFIKGDKAVQLQTVGSGPLTDLDGLKELARIVERRL